MTAPTPPAPRSPTGPVAGQRFGDFDLIREIGRGGMGVVFEARQHQLDRPVALKVIRHPDEAVRSRFVREGKALARVASPNVVRMHHAGRIGEDLYLAMEFIDGLDLAKRLRMGWRPSVVQAVTLVLQAAQGLAAAAAEGLIHRDIKPANLLLARDGTLKIVDFGFVRMPGESQVLTKSGLVVGTVEYLSPEQALGKPCDQRSDIYSLGVVFYELLTGVRPFAGQAMAIIDHHIFTAPREPRLVVPGIPLVVQDVVLRCLDKRAAQRYQSADELAAALRAALAHLAMEPSRRTRRLVLLVVAAIVVTSVAAIAVWYAASTA
ncbi:MAG TPA: serine/threonine-protein kinase [Planctomycetota bacterium]|nr:serine/threonine-protein kinase [Planctomycetota bacterium]